MKHYLVSSFSPPKDDKTGMYPQDGKYYLKGVEVSEQTYEFGKALLRNRSFANCRFASKGFGGRAIHAYFPDEIYSRGIIGYDDIGVKDDNGGGLIIRKFFVHAKSIINNKVKPANKEHQIAGSDNVGRAVKLALRHLREYSMSDVLEQTKGYVVQPLSLMVESDSESCGSGQDEIEKELHGGGELVAEFRNMLTTGYEFVNPTIRKTIVSYLEALDAETVTKMRKIMLSLVTVSNECTGSPMQVKVARSIAPINFQGRNLYTEVDNAIQKDHVDTYTAETVPEDVAHGISTLSIVNVNQYVDGVGIRASHNVFYIMEDM